MHRKEGVLKLTFLLRIRVTLMMTEMQEETQGVVNSER